MQSLAFHRDLNATSSSNALLLSSSIIPPLVLLPSTHRHYITVFLCHFLLLDWRRHPSSAPRSSSSVVSAPNLVFFFLHLILLWQTGCCFHFQQSHNFSISIASSQLEKTDLKWSFTKFGQGKYGICVIPWHQEVKERTIMVFLSVRVLKCLLAKALQNHFTH